MTLADYIRDDFKARVDSGRRLPEAITLTALAEEYGVSLSPVREAVHRLVGEGYLSKRDNGRLAVKEVRPSTRGKGPSKPSPPRRNWDEIIGADLIRRSVRGVEEFLREEATAERYGIGRTHIRQVFGRLAGRGLIEHVPRRGWRLRSFSAGDMLDYLEVREAMELKAMSLARPRLDRGDLERMLGGNRPPARSEPPRLDNQLHGYLVERSGNRFMREFFQQPAARYYTALFDRAAPEAQLVSEMARQHCSILEALISKKWKRAENELSAHIRAQGPVVERMLRRVAALK